MKNWRKVISPIDHSVLFYINLINHIFTISKDIGNKEKWGLYYNSLPIVYNNSEIRETKLNHLITKSNDIINDYHCDMIKLNYSEIIGKYKMERCLNDERKA